MSPLCALDFEATLNASRSLDFFDLHSVLAMGVTELIATP